MFSSCESVCVDASKCVSTVARTITEAVCLCADVVTLIVSYVELMKLYRCVVEIQMKGEFENGR